MDIGGKFHVVCGTRIAVDYEPTRFHEGRLCAFTVDRGGGMLVSYLAYIPLEMAIRTDRALRKYLLDNLHSAIPLRSFNGRTK